MPGPLVPRRTSGGWVPWGTVDGMADKGDWRMRVIAELALAAETGGGIEPAVQAAYLAGVEPYEIAELGGLPMRGVLVTVGQPWA